MHDKKEAHEKRKTLNNYAPYCISGREDQEQGQGS